MIFGKYLKALPLAAAALLSAPVSHYVFSLLQGKSLDFKCELKSLNRLDEATLKTYLADGKSRNRSCIADQNKAFNMANKLGYDLKKPGARFDDIQEKLKTVINTRSDIAKFEADNTPSEDFVNAELNSITEAYDTVITITSRGVKTPEIKSCTIVTAKNIYNCGNMNALCR